MLFTLVYALRCLRCFDCFMIICFRFGFVVNELVACYVFIALCIFYCLLLFYLLYWFVVVAYFGCLVGIMVVLMFYLCLVLFVVLVILLVLWFTVFDVSLIDCVCLNLCFVLNWLWVCICFGLWVLFVFVGLFIVFCLCWFWVYLLACWFCDDDFAIVFSVLSGLYLGVCLFVCINLGSDFLITWLSLFCWFLFDLGICFVYLGLICADYICFWFWGNWTLWFVVYILLIFVLTWLIFSVVYGSVFEYCVVDESWLI